MVLEEGAVIVWLWLPPSLQEEKAYRVPEVPDWGEDTDKVWEDPTAQVKVCGAV